MRLLLAGLSSAALCACGAGASASAPPHQQQPQRYLLTLDQLVTPDFSVYVKPHAVNAAAIVAGSATAAKRLQGDGLQAAASVEFARAADIALANGPIDISNTVERFAGESGATHSYEADVAALDALPGVTPLSTGPLGDQAHADSLTRATASGVRAVEYTVEWRLGNLVSIVIVRGRDGGTQLSDALILAQHETQHEIDAG